MRTYEISSLHSALADSVRREQHDKLVNEHEKICEQYRLLMVKNVDMANKVKGDVDTDVSDVNRILNVGYQQLADDRTQSDNAQRATGTLA